MTLEWIKDNNLRLNEDRGRMKYDSCYPPYRSSSSSSSPGTANDQRAPIKCTSICMLIY